MRDRRARAHILHLALEDDARVGQWRAALPFLDDARVAGLGQRAGAVVGRDVERVAVAPVHAALGFGQLEAVGDELFPVEIKLTINRGIRAAARKHDQTTVVIRL